MSPGCSGFHSSSARVRALDVGTSMPANIVNHPKCSAASLSVCLTPRPSVDDALAFDSSPEYTALKVIHDKSCHGGRHSVESRLGRRVDGAGSGTNASPNPRGVNARRTRSPIRQTTLRLAHCASGSGRTWKCTTRGLLPLPPSLSHGVRSPLVTHRPRPFQPARASSIRPSMPFM
jgi:hypothetical protein